jgi:iron complex transport system substrate-binding protein
VSGSQFQGRIVSLLPSATEMVFALGLEDRLVAVTHECDFPAAARKLPVLVKPALALEGLSQADIDTAVSARLHEGGSLYEIDETMLIDLAPDLILAQNLCQVCAPSGHELSRALTRLPKEPQVLWMSPRNLAGVRANLEDLAAATTCLAQGESLLADWELRLQAVAERAARIKSRPRVFCMEWLDPVYCPGHWIPEMVRLAGGEAVLGREGAESVRIDWGDVCAQRPEILILMPCGYTLAQGREIVGPLAQYSGWSDLPAVRDGQVWLVDANAYFARPGPRLIEGIELLSHLFAGGPFAGPADACERLAL